MNEMKIGGTGVALSDEGYSLGFLLIDDEDREEYIEVNIKLGMTLDQLCNILEDEYVRLHKEDQNDRDY